MITIFAENKMFFFLAQLKKTFRQYGQAKKRDKVLSTIMETIHESYPEANYYTNFYWLVSELLMNDPEFHKLCSKIDTEALKLGLADVVDSTTARVIRLTE